MIRSHGSHDWHQVGVIEDKPIREEWSHSIQYSILRYSLYEYGKLQLFNGSLVDLVDLQSVLSVV